MYIGPWQEYQLSKQASPHIRYKNLKASSSSVIHGLGSGEGDVEDLQAKVEYLQRLLKEQQDEGSDHIKALLARYEEEEG